MKKFFSLLTVVLLCSLITAKAQIQRGNLLVGADLANFNLDLNKGGNFSMRLNPKLAFFIKNNLAVGPYVTLLLSTAKDAGTNVGYGIGGLGRYYLNDTALNLLRHGRFFVEANVGIEGDNPADGDNTNGLGLGFGPGYAYFITPNIGLETLLKYQGIVGFGSNATSSNLALSFGFQIYLSSRRAAAVVNELK